LQRRDVQRQLITDGLDVFLFHQRLEAQGGRFGHQFSLDGAGARLRDGVVCFALRAEHRRHENHDQHHDG
jgi:hypothetical protein